MVFILGALACLGPLSIDAYLPAFGDIARAFERSQTDVQKTLGYYMLANACTMLVYGTLSDAFGRRRVLLGALTIYTAGSLVAAVGPSFEWLLAGRILQGLSAGAGMAIAQAIVNDCYEGPVAQRTLSYIIMVFSVSPAVAPILGGYLSAGFGWRMVFVLMMVFALFSMALCMWRLPETLPDRHRQPFAPRRMLGNILRVARDRTFLALSCAFGLLFASLGILIGGAHDYVTHVLGLPETAFGYFFIPLVCGMLSGSYLAARLAQHTSPQRVIALGFAVLTLSCVWNLVYTGVSETLSVIPAVVPIALYACGLTLAFPSMTLLVLGRQPALAGTAASVLGFVQMMFFSVASGWLVAWVYGSAWRMAVALTLGMALAGMAWPLIYRLAAARPARTAPARR